MIRHKTDTLLAGQEDRLRDAVSVLLQQDAMFYDVESVGEHRGVPKLNTVTWISISSHGIDLVIPFGHPIGTRVIGQHKEPRVYGGDGPKAGTKYMANILDYEPPPPQMERGNVFEILAPLFLDDRIIKVAQYQPFDAGSIAKYIGELPHPPMDDTLLREWEVNENLTGRLGIKATVKRRFGVVWDTEDVGKCVEKHPFGDVAHYSYMDSHMGWLTYLRQEADLKREYKDDDRILRLERDLLPVICQMRIDGTPVDVPRLREMETELSARLVKEEAEVYKAAGRSFNLNSSPQKQQVMYGPKSEGGQGLKPWKLTDGGKKEKKAGKEESISWFSTDDSVLESYPDNPVAAALRTYGDTSKLLGTYVQGWLGVEGDKKKPPKIFDGWIYTNFKQVGPVTGRSASSGPNLQNIPRPDDEDGKLIRGAVLAPEDWRLVVADLGQIEPRVLAHYLGRGMLYEGFLNGIDPYVVNAAAALGKATDEVTKEERQKFGKAQPLDAPILTPSGWRKMGEMQVGSLVSTPDGGSARVGAVYPQGVRPIWKILFSDGTSVLCDPEHLWNVELRRSQKIMTAQEILDSGLTTGVKKQAWKYAVPLSAPVEFRESSKLPLDPYLLGVLIGDGCLRHPASVSFASADEEIVREVEYRLPDGLSVRRKGKYDHVITSGHRHHGAGNIGPVKRALIDLDLWGCDSHLKFIPHRYRFASIDNRIDLLRGLMDTDGHCSARAGTNEFITVSPRLAEDVAFLVRSLGGKARARVKKTSWTHNGVRNEGIAWRVSMWTPINPFKLPRKAEAHIHRPPTRKCIVGIESAGWDEAQCIYVKSADHMYITEGVTPTHNTLMLSMTYGQGEKATAAKMGVPLKHAKTILRTHESNMPEVDAFKEAVYRKARSRKPPYLTTMLGRKRRLPELNSSDDWIRARAERQAFNSLIQGSAADLLKLATIRANRMLKEQVPSAFISLTVHDELVALAKKEDAEQVKAILTEAMIGPEIQKLIKVPLTVEAAICQRWNEAK